MAGNRCVRVRSAVDDEVAECASIHGGVHAIHCSVAVRVLRGQGHGERDRVRAEDVAFRRLRFGERVHGRTGVVRSQAVDRHRFDGAVVVVAHADRIDAVRVLSATGLDRRVLVSIGALDELDLRAIDGHIEPGSRAAVCDRPSMSSLTS